MRFFRKIGKVALFGIKLTINLTIWVENSEKSDFSLKPVRIFHTLLLQLISCGYTLTQSLKQLFSTQTKVEISPKSNLTKYPQIIVENTENLPNSSICTIEYNIVRNSHLLSQNWHFLKVPQQLFYKQA